MSQEKSKCAYLDCGRESLKTSKDGYCVLHAEAEEKDVIEFQDALEDYIREAKTRKLDYDFTGFVFVGDIYFKRAFEVNLFENADFRGAEFHGEASFWKAEFHGEVNFERVRFRGNVHFYVKKSHKGVSFLGAELYGKANFSGEFCGHTSFNQVKFHKDTFFWGAEFHKGVDFNEAEFRARAFLSPTLIKGKISFVYATLENISLTPLNLDENAQIDFSGTRLRNTEMRYEDIKDHIIQEEVKGFSKAKEIYLLLKNNFHTLGRYDDESWAFQKEKEMERKSYWQNERLHKWVWSKFLSLLYAYGEGPKRIVAWAILIIFFFAFLFLGFGIEKPSSEEPSICNIAQQVWLGIQEKDLITRIQNVPWAHFLDCLYFSGVTFTTLGYGDFRPLPGVSRLIAWIEAFIGALMMALFIYTFARKTGGR